MFVKSCRTFAGAQHALVAMTSHRYPVVLCAPSQGTEGLRRLTTQLNRGWGSHLRQSHIQDSRAFNAAFLPSSWKKNIDCLVLIPEQEDGWESKKEWVGWGGGGATSGQGLTGDSYRFLVGPQAEFLHVSVSCCEILTSERVEINSRRQRHDGRDVLLPEPWTLRPTAPDVWLKPPQS